MRRLFIPFLFGIALVAVSMSTHGGPLAWLVQKTSGTAVYSASGATQLAVTRGVALKRGAMVRTGGDGRVLLVRSEESVFIGPDTIASIAAHPTPGVQTTVLLQSGRANLDVRKRSRAHFSVETPYLVAVVKGTKFKVTVARSSAEVSVEEGRVEVKALKSGQYVDVFAGQNAVVNAAGSLKLTGTGKLAAIKAGIPRGPVVAVRSSLASGNLSVHRSSTAQVGISTNFNVGNVSASRSVGVGGTSVGAGVNVGSGVSAGGGVSVGGGASVGGGVSVGGGGVSIGGGLGIGGL